MKATCVTSVALALCALLSGCSGQPSSNQGNKVKSVVARPLAACASAQTRNDGTIQVRDTNCQAQEMEGVIALDQKIASINQRFPAPDPPRDAARLKALRVDPPGLIYFNNAPTVRIDGIRCSQRGIDSISKKILAPDALVAISPSTSKSQDPRPSVVWVIYPSTDKELSASEMSSAIADTALMNNLCEAEYSPTSKYNERYAALAQAFSTSAGRAAGKSGR